MQADEVQFAWEYSKENVLPLRRGRDTKKLNTVLSTRKCDREEQLKQEQRLADLSLCYVSLVTVSPLPPFTWTEHLKTPLKAMFWTIHSRYGSGSVFGISGFENLS